MDQANWRANASGTPRHTAPSANGHTPTSHNGNNADKRVDSPLPNGNQRHSTTRQDERSKSNCTCQNWIMGRCTETNVPCPRPHQFFPVISERTHPDGRKTKRCECGEDERRCWLPADVCAYGHEDHEKTLDGAPAKFDTMAKRKRRVERLVDQRLYRAKLVYECKNCGQEFDDQDLVIGHCNPMQCSSIGQSMSPSKRENGQVGSSMSKDTLAGLNKPTRQQRHGTSNASTHTTPRKPSKPLSRSARGVSNNNAINSHSDEPPTHNKNSAPQQTNAPLIVATPCQQQQSSRHHASAAEAGDPNGEPAWE